MGPEMGFTEDMEWLKSDEEGLKKIFLIVAEGNGRTTREIKEIYGSKEWWPVKVYLDALLKRGLIFEKEGRTYALTDNGKKLVEGIKAIGRLQELI
ncbi:MAG: winged helix-turn-helix domain-containing protein [Candidatus Hadarchaeales archaeon]